jgi:hypothetical protein
VTLSREPNLYKIGVNRLYRFSHFSSDSWNQGKCDKTVILRDHTKQKTFQREIALGKADE